jgi:membrane protein DedA with SNARE-associated domain
MIDFLRPGGYNMSMAYLHLIISVVAIWATNIISWLGYPGLVLAMAMESMIIPLPSELVMPFAGWLVAQGKFNLYLVILFSTLGSIIGSFISYYLGYYGGNQLVLRWGKYFLLDDDDLRFTEKWFSRRGELTILIGRFVPVVRHLISIPAGIGKMDLKKFTLYTIIGAGIWNTILIWVGLKLGENWESLRRYSESFTLPIIIIIILALVYFIIKRIGDKKKKRD